MENWEGAIDMLSATHAFDQPQGGVSIDNRIIKSVAMLMDERGRYQEELAAATERLEAECAHRDAYRQERDRYREALQGVRHRLVHRVDRDEVCYDWCPLCRIDMWSATHAFDQPQGGVSIDNRIIKSVAMLMDERGRYQEELAAATERLEAECAHRDAYRQERDRYREALERIALLNPWSDIARDALRGGEE